jgi:hypothetical protein
LILLMPGGTVGYTLRRLTLLALASVALIIAGCGGGDDSGGQQDSVATSQADTEAEEFVTSMLLRLSDFPTGWRAQPSEDEEGCTGIEEVTEEHDVLAKMDSDDFVHGDTTQATSSAGLFENETTARDAFNYLEGLIQSEEFRDCVNDFLRDQAEEDVTFGEVQIGQVSFPSFGDRSSAWEVVIPAESQGFSVEGYVDAVYILRSNAISVLVFTDFLTPFDEQLRTDLAAVIEERMDEAVSENP